MRIPQVLKTTFLGAALSCVGLAAASAQTTATWIGASGGEWNTLANWDIGIPDAGTNAVIGSTITANYNLPMVSPGFGVLTNAGILIINTNGFNSGQIFLNKAGGRAQLLINSGGALNVSGVLGLCSNSVVTIAAGSSLTVGGTFAIGCNVTNGGTSSYTPGSFGVVTNNGGTINSAATTINSGNATEAGNPLFVINGGVNNLGNVNIGRPSGSTQNALGTDGFIIYGGSVNMSSLIVGNNNWTTMLVSPGSIVTNAGSLILRNATAARPARILQTGGFFVTLGTNIFIPPAAAGAGVTYSITGGTNYSGGFQFGDTTANIGTVNFTNAANIFVGSLGMASNGAVGLNISLNTGGRFAAITDWTNGVPINMAGGSLDAEDDAGNPHNIYSSGVLRGTGNLIKIGGGTLTLGAANTYSGSTLINAGTVALDVGGNLAGTPIIVGSGTIFDVSAASFTLGSAKTIAGVGTIAGAFIAGSGSAISPAGVNAQGTLNFANGLAAAGANFNMELGSDPTGNAIPNDMVNVVGDLNLSGANNVVVTPVGSLGVGTYRLIKYSGNLIGSLANLTCVAGTLSNPAGEIDLIVTTVRPSANLIWKGDGVANVWDTATSSDWLNGASLDRFYTGDTNTFNDNTTNFVVNISGTVTPAPAAVVTVNAVNNYTFTGTGDITGATGLTKTNAGNLTILTTNDYTGITTLNGGTLSVSNLANGDTSSPIGAAANTPANLIFNGGTLAYLGGNVTIDRGATLLANNGTFNVVSNTTLTLAGNLTGPGALIESGSGQITLTGGNDYAGGTVINGGNLRANPAGTLGTNVLILSGGTNAANFQFAGDAQVLNNTLSVAGTNNYLTMNGNDTIGMATGSGTVYLNGASGNILTLQAADSSGFNGTFSLNTVGTLRLFPSSGTTLNASGATFNLGIGTGLLNNRNGGTYSLGALAGGSGAQLRGSANSGTAVTTYIIGGNNQSTTFSGSIATGAGGSGAGVNLIKTGIGTLTLNGGFTPVVGLDSDFNLVTNNNYVNLITYNGFTTISNGVLALAAPSVLINSPTITLAAPTAILDASQMGYADSTGTNLITNSLFEVVSGQTLNGLGMILGNLQMDAGSTLNVGLPGGTGILTVTNTISLNGAATMKISRVGSPASDELVAQQSAISFGGTLTVTNIGGQLQAGDTFTLFSAAGSVYNNSFSSITLPSNATWDTSKLSVNGTIRVLTAAGPPVLGSANFSQLSSGSITLAAMGNPGSAVAVLSSTNVALPLAQWTPVTSGNFDSNGNYNPTISVNPAAPQQYFILQAQ
jgi:fibronectin-binding autotransporter adhesin